MAIVTQPGHPNFMPPPQLIPGCPPGLEYLSALDQVIIKQDVVLLEVLTGFDACNSYRIFNNQGQQIYMAGEESNCCARNICRTQRGFIYHIVNNYNQEVCRVSRDFNCIAGNRAWPCDFCRYYAEVIDVTGNTLGFVSDRFTCLACRPYFGIYDQWKNLEAEIRGPFCAIQNVLCSWDIDFPIYSMAQDDEAPPIGQISKTWEGMLKNCCTTADNFQVSFPMHMDVRTKVLMISAVLIIDMMMYEERESEEHKQPDSGHPVGLRAGY